MKHLTNIGIAIAMILVYAALSTLVYASEGPAPLQEGAAQPTAPQVLIQDASAYSDYLKNQLALQQQEIDHLKSMQNLEIELAEKESASRLDLLNTIKNDVWTVLEVILFGIAGILVLWIQAWWMDKNPKRYYKDELDRLVTDNRNPTDAQARVGQAISMSIASRRIALAIVIVAGFIAGTS